MQVFRTNVIIIAEGDIPPYYNLGHGLTALDSDYVLVDDCLFESCARAGLIYTASGGAIYRTRTQDVRFGLVLLEEPKPNWEDPSNSFVGTEENVLTDGALPVPGPPPLPE